MEDSQDKQAWKSSAYKTPARCRTFDFIISATDLRSLQLRKEACDENSEDSGDEAIEESEKNVEADDESPEKVHATCIPSKSLSRWRKLVKRCKKKSVKCFSTFHPVQKISSKMLRHGDDHSAPHVEVNLCKMKANWKVFTLSELQKATNNFSADNVIGKGGFAEVYKGCLKGGQLVAIKRLTKGSHEERISVFLSELGIIAHVDHPNTAKLIGYGVEGGLHIVLELSSLGSLATLLYGPREKLTWSMRYKIALGTAEGLVYLHEDCQRRIIHRDIKADNVLLTENFEPQICDFGLGKWLPRQWTHHYVSKFEGTFGYFAPEYFMQGIVDEKTDVYAYGVLLLELITGRRALDCEQQSIVLWAKPLLDEHDLEKLVDPILGIDYDEEELDRVVLTASLCVQQTSVLRPRMNQVIVLLKGDDYCCPKTAKHHLTRPMRRTYSEELLDAKEYNLTKQLNQLRRHKEVAFASL